MRISTLTSGAGLGGALTLLRAGTARAASGAATGESTPIRLTPAATAHAAAPSGGSSSILRTIIALIVVIGIIYAVARILRAVKGRDAVRASGHGLAQIATLPLGPNRSVVLVRAGHDVVLVGVAEQGITPLRTYSEAEAISAGLELPVLDLPVGEDPIGIERPLDRLRRLTARS